MLSRLLSFTVVITTAIVVQKYLAYWSVPSVPEPPFRDIEGWTAPGWKQVAAAFRSNLRSGLERGASFAAYHKGELVVEVRGGYANWEAQQPWRADTLSPYLSSTKGVLAVLVARLVEHGLLDYDEVVCKYWPEFNENGKENITVKQLMTHQTGLILTDEPMTPELLKNIDKLGKVLAKQKPLWEPGSQIGYQVWTHGLYIDQLIRRVDPKGRGVKEYFKEEIAVPFGIDFHIGLPRTEHHRVATIYAPSAAANLMALVDPMTYRLEMAKLSSQAYINRLLDNFQALFYQRYNNPYMREINQPSYLGYGTGKSLAKFYSFVISGATVNGKKMLSRKSVEQFLTPTVIGDDVVIHDPHVNALGMVLRNNTLGQYIFGHPGAGGHMAYADPENELSMSYVTNFMGTRSWGNDRSYLKLEEALYKCLLNQQKT